MDFTLVAACALILGAVVAVARGWDVRLALLLAALAMAGLKGDLSPVLRQFLETFSDEKFVIPICSAMGFAYVLRKTECDQHLVRLLVAPVSRVPWLVIPGVIVVGFVVNIPIISQTSTAVCLGPVVIPLMRAVGYPPATIGATLLLGASVGGELFNPGAPELLTLSKLTGHNTRDLVPYLMPVVLPMLLVSGLVFWGLSPKPKPEVGVGEAVVAFRVNLLKAFVPLVPLLLLLTAGPPLRVLEIPLHWLVDPKKPNAELYHGTRLIGVAMLVGVLAAVAVSPKHFKTGMKDYFEGAGYGFTHIVSLIVTASCFGKAIETVGLAQALGTLIQNAPHLLVPLAGGIPFAFAAISGSGMASTQSLYGFFHEPAGALQQDPAAIGAVVSLASAAGRTVSPVAAVTLMCAALTGTKPFDLVKRVALPLVTGLVVVIGLRMMKVI
jgi:DcuC family C4-dicarboxylate transporter